MNGNSGSTALFEEAHQYYQAKDFKKARETISAYKKTVRYDLFPQSDKRNTNNEVSISIIIVSYGANEALLECLESLLDRQDNKDFEIIVVDNGSNERIIQALKKYPILYIAAPINFFPSEGRNIGAHFAKGGFLAFLDDDALVHRNYIKSIKAAWESFDFIGIRGKILPKSNSANNSFMGHYDFGLYPVPAILMTEGHMAIEKKAFFKVDGFDPLIFGGEGTELSHRCKKAFPQKDIYYWPEMIIYHDFVRGANLSAKKKRHALAKAYFNYLSPEINDMQAKYTQWYKSRPMGGGVKYDNRSLIRKIRSYVHEKLIAIKNIV